MGKREETMTHILTTTTQFLAEEGIGPLSMRKIADRAALRLSNLQYYYKNQEDLLRAVVAHYFEWCEQEVLRSFPVEDLDSVDLEFLLRKILGSSLIDENFKAQCAMFREIWALATRSPQIETIVEEYYRNYCQRLIELLSLLTPQAEAIVCLLQPYVEGYSIMGKSLPLQNDQIVELLVQTVLRLTEEG